jgi:hypothetical protein
MRVETLVGWANNPLVGFLKKVSSHNISWAVAELSGLSDVYPCLIPRIISKWERIERMRIE